MEPDHPMPTGSDAPTGGKKRGQFGCGFWVLLSAVLLLFASIAIPNFVRARTRPSSNACINNLRQIDGAKQQWALEYKKNSGDVPTLRDIAVYMYREPIRASNLACPSAGGGATFDSSYEIGAVTNPPRCKIVPETHVLP